MSHIQEEIKSITSVLPAGVRLVAVSKFNPESAIQEAYDCGQRIFGESQVQELQRKHEALPQDIEWHFIGHLQTNKMKYIAPYISLIHAVDSEKLLTEINKQAQKCGRIIPCLLQLHVAREETKFGFTEEECWDFLKEGRWKELKNVAISGIMCMASNVDDEKQIRNEFHSAHEFFKKAKAEFFMTEPSFNTCSWGMSHDYHIAIEEGSTLIRVGSLIFGERKY